MLSLRRQKYVQAPHCTAKLPSPTANYARFVKTGKHPKSELCDQLQLSK